jgi:hypothetical protein
MSDQDPLTGRPVTPPDAPVPPTGTPPAGPPAGTVPPAAPTVGAVPPTSAGQGDGPGAGDKAKVKADQAKDVARDKADQAKHKAEEATEDARRKASAAGEQVGEHAGQVAESAKAHAGEVVEEAKRQAVGLADQGLTQLREQADEQADRAAGALQGWSEQLHAMARGEKPPEGPMADLLQQGAQRMEDVASRLRTGGLEMALQDVQRFARRRPGLFLASAFGAGIAAGRLLRNSDTSQLTGSNGNGNGQQGVRPGPELERSRGGTPATYSTGTAYTGVPGAATMADADPLTAGDPTGVQGGRR